MHPFWWHGNDPAVMFLYASRWCWNQSIWRILDTGLLYLEGRNVFKNVSVVIVSFVLSVALLFSWADKMSWVKSNAACHAWIAVTGHLTVCVLYVGPSVSPVSTIIIPFAPVIGSNCPVPSTCFHFYHPSSTFCHFVTTFCNLFYWFFLSPAFFIFRFTVYLLFILFLMSVLSPDVTLCGWQDVKIQLLTTYISPFHTSRPRLVFNWL